MKNLLKWYLISNYVARTSTDDEINKGYVQIIFVIFLAFISALIVSLIS